MRYMYIKMLGDCHSIRQRQCAPSVVCRNDLTSSFIVPSRSYVAQRPSTTRTARAALHMHRDLAERAYTTHRSSAAASRTIAAVHRAQMHMVSSIHSTILTLYFASRNET